LLATLKDEKFVDQMMNNAKTVTAYIAILDEAKITAATTKAVGLLLLDGKRTPFSLPTQRW
jgi:hypothetical protein